MKCKDHDGHHDWIRPIDLEIIVKSIDAKIFLRMIAFASHHTLLCYWNAQLMSMSSWQQQKSNKSKAVLHQLTRQSLCQKILDST